MVTFNCEVCNDTVPKKNTEKHYHKCPDACYTCIDCSKTFNDGVSYKYHTQCLTEDEKYQGTLYKGKGKTKNRTEKKADDTKLESTKVSKISKLRSKLKSGRCLYEICDSMDKKSKKKLLKNLIVDEKGHIILKDH